MQNKKKRRMRHLLIFGVFFFHSLNTQAQTLNIKDTIQRRMQSREYWFPDSLLKNPEFQRRIIPKLEKVSKNILTYPHEMRDNYYWALVDLYKLHPDSKSQGKIVELLLLGCLDRSEWLRLHNMHDLVRLAHPEDFNARRLEMLKVLILHPTLHTTPLFPLVGKLDWPDGERIMRNFFQNGVELLPDDEYRPGGFRASPKWRSAMALAKKGNEEAMGYLIQKAKAEENRDVLYDIFQDFAYIRSRASIDFLIEQVFSDFEVPSFGDTLNQSDFSAAIASLRQIVKGLDRIVSASAHNKEIIRSWINQNRTTYEILPEQ